MNRRLIFIVMVLALLGGLSRLLFDGRRSHQLARQLRDEATRFRSEPNPCIENFAHLSLDDTMACAWSGGGLPDGLEAGTSGSIDWAVGEGWLRQAQTEFAAAGGPASQHCLDALRFSALLAGQGGARGERYGSWLLMLAVQPCALVQPTAEQLERFKSARSDLLHQLGPMMTGLVVDGQVRRFGSWMSPEERQGLPVGMRELAAAAPPPPFSPIERNSRLAIWTRAQRVGQQLIDLGAAPEATTDALIVTYQGEWPERVSDPKKVHDAYDEERLRESAVSLLYDAWSLGPHCAPGPDATSTVRLDGTDCLLSNQKLHVQLPSRSE